MVPDPGAGDHVFDDAVDDFVVESGEAGPVVFEVQGFGVAGEGRGRFGDDEVVYVFGEGVQADFQPVEFGVDHDEVVDFAVLGGWAKRFEAIGTTCRLDCSRGQSYLSIWWEVRSVLYEIRRQVMVL